MSSAKRRIATIQEYKDVFNSPTGKKVLWDLMKEHFVLDHTFRENVQEMAFCEGQRNVILRILNLLKLDVKKLQERLEEEERREQNQ